MVSFPNVEFAKFPEVDEVDAGIMSTVFGHFFKKFPDAKVHLAYKGYNKGGLKTQHEVHATLVLHGHTFYSSNVDWNLLTVIEAVLRKLEKEITKADEKE